MSKRIYVCHTFYHVYVSCLKELHLLHRADLSREKAAEGSGALGRAHLMLSKMSNDFSGMLPRAKECPLFEEVFEFDEKRDSFFPELAPLKENTGSILKNMRNRIRFCKRFPELLEPYIPVDFRSYDDIYVFCDIDPVGYYLNGKKIPYHAVEDGLDTLVYANDAVYDNKSFFGLKTWMAARGWIHIQSGYSKYCLDMEVNDLSKIKRTNKKMKELQRALLTAELTQTDKKLLLDLFVADIGKLRAQLADETDRDRVLVLSEPLCEDREIRKKLHLDIIEAWRHTDKGEAAVYFKQHPRDDVDYTRILPDDVILLDKSFPMEMLYLIEGLHFARVVTVYTVLNAFEIADEKIMLGDAFMDKYEDPSKHWMGEN